jgi:hypothetical protein
MTGSFMMKKLETAIYTLKQTKSPGPGGVTNGIFSRLGPVAKITLPKILNISWKREIAPHAWKEAKLAPIPKKGKEKLDPNSYRSISLLTCTCKLMERVIISRLKWHLEKKRLLLPQQAEFRQHLSIEDQVAHIAQEMKMLSERKTHCCSLGGYGESFRQGLEGRSKR